MNAGRILGACLIGAYTHYMGQPWWAGSLLAVAVFLTSGGLPKRATP